MGHPLGGYGIWFYHDCAPPTISLWLLLCLWMWDIFFLVGSSILLSMFNSQLQFWCFLRRRGTCVLLPHHFPLLLLKIWLFVCLLLSCISSLCMILGINLLPDKLLATIFFPFSSLPFYFCFFFFSCKAFLVWCSPSCLFLLLLCLFWNNIHKSSANPLLESLPPMSSFTRSFMISTLTFKLIHFELIFVSSVK